MRKGLAWGAVVAGVLVTLAVAFGAYATAQYAWDQLVSYESPFVDEGLPPAAAGPPLSRRVVFVVVDGMTADVAHQMDGLAALSEFGSDMIAVTPQPSLSFPTWTTLMSGAPHQVTGVTTNWYEGPVRVETLLDTTLAAGRTVVVVASEDFDGLFGASRAGGVYLEEWDGEYLTATLVDRTLELVEQTDPSFVFVLLPDLDEEGHRSGADSPEYLETARRIDLDLTRLVETLQDGETSFVVAADHGHVPGGGHGGWEEDVTHAPAVFAGAGIALGAGEIAQEDVAPTVATLLGVPSPRNATGRVAESVLASASAEVLSPARSQRTAAIGSFIEVVSGERPSVLEVAGASDQEFDAMARDATDERLASDRRSNLPLGLAIGGGALAAVLVIGVVSWRALVAAGAGVLAYYVIYDGVFFLVHGTGWSLSAFNSEDMIDSFLNLRVVEAAAAGLAAALVAGAVYPLLRKGIEGARGERLPGWLALGPAAVLAVQATLAVQVAWYLWWWGADVTWHIPDLMWGFKFDLDLLQLAGLGLAGALAPLATFVIGRVHPRLRGRQAAQANETEGADA